MRVEELTGQLQEYASDPKNTKSIFTEAAQQLADELIALQSIFGQDSVALLEPSNGIDWRAEDSIRLCINVPMDLGDDEVTIKVSATIPSGYPQSSSPQLQLLSKYIGPHGVDHSLFGQILRIFYHSAEADDHSLFEKGEVCLFDGIERVREKVEAWYSEREAEKLPRREEENTSHGTATQSKEHTEHSSAALKEDVPIEEDNDFIVFSSPAISERKSVFVGHAAILTDVIQVDKILAKITEDKRIARASHPTIYAWTCRSGTAIHRDCNDDGETAAGGRLAHLLDLLHLENVIVVVTRWYGGVHLGADRFKMINRAARDALEIAQLVSGPLNTGSKIENSCKRK
jgi:hypothetical protein